MKNSIPNLLQRLETTQNQLTHRLQPFAKGLNQLVAEQHPLILFWLREPVEGVQTLDIQDLEESCRGHIELHEDSVHVSKDRKEISIVATLFAPRLWRPFERKIMILAPLKLVESYADNKKAKLRQWANQQVIQLTEKLSRQTRINADGIRSLTVWVHGKLEDYKRTTKSR